MRTRFPHGLPRTHDTALQPADAVAAEAPKGQFSIPKELFRMAEFIYSRGLKEVGFLNRVHDTTHDTN